MRSMKLTVTYRESQAKYTSKRAKVKAALDKARLIVAEHISVDMTDFEKEKILHDYIIKIQSTILKTIIRIHSPMKHLRNTAVWSWDMQCARDMQKP